MQLNPGDMIGILGGGQLGLMLAQAAEALGFETHIYCPEGDTPAAAAATHVTHGAYKDESKIKPWAKSVDVITYEFENIPLRTVETLAKITPVRPGVQALKVAQNRQHEKDFCIEHGIPTTLYQVVLQQEDLTGIGDTIGYPSVMKTLRMGYDGKGQAILKNTVDLNTAWADLGRQPCLVENFVPFEREVSILAARAVDGGVACWPLVENRHENHILKESIAPAKVAEETAAAAERVATRILSEMQYIGVLAVEFFLLSDGQLLVNEMAPRVHNSGHWSIEGAHTSQFTQHIRAISGMGLGSTDLVAPSVMVNLLGDDIKKKDELAALPDSFVHDYGKAEIREGRKMGHVTRLIK